MRTQRFDRRRQGSMPCFFVFVGSRTFFTCQRLDGGAHGFDRLFDLHFVLKAVVLYASPAPNTQFHRARAQVSKTVRICARGATYLLRLARHETVVFAINVKIVLRHDSKAEFRARASKHLFCTRRKRTEMTGWVEYRRAHDDRQQAQKRGRQDNDSEMRKELSAYTEKQKGSSARYRISVTEGWKGFLQD